MNTWRINLKPGSANGIDPRKLCINKGIVGVGWQIDWEQEPILWETYEKEATEMYYNKGDKSWWPALNAIYYRIKKDDLIWTVSGKYNRHYPRLSNCLKTGINDFPFSVRLCSICNGFC
jgi:hypothetical protein